jgi:hypothetical protein
MKEGDETERELKEKNQQETVMNGIGIVVHLQDAEMASFMSHVAWSWLVAVAFLAR